MYQTGLPLLFSFNNKLNFKKKMITPSYTIEFITKGLTLPSSKRTKKMESKTHLDEESIIKTKFSSSEYE